MKRWLLILICLPSFAVAAQKSKTTQAQKAKATKSTKTSKATKTTPKRSLEKGLEEVHQVNRTPPGAPSSVECPNPPRKPESINDSPQPAEPPPIQIACEEKKMQAFYAITEEPAASFMQEMSGGTLAKCVELTQQPTFASYLHSYCTGMFNKSKNPSISSERTPPCPIKEHTALATNAFANITNCMKTAPSMASEQFKKTTVAKIEEINSQMNLKRFQLKSAKELKPAERQKLTDDIESLDEDLTKEKYKLQRENLLSKMLYNDAPLKEEHLIPLFAQESGFHYSSVSETSAAGYGQLTYDAIEQVNRYYRETYLDMFKKPGMPESCAKLAPLLEKDMQPGASKRCEAMVPPNRAVQNMLYSIIYFEEIRRSMMDSLADIKSGDSKGLVAKKLPWHSKDKDWDIPTLARRFAYISYNSGPGSGQKILNMYLYDKAKKPSTQLSKWVQLLPRNTIGQPQKFIPGIIEKGNRLNEQMGDAGKCAEY